MGTKGYAAAASLALVAVALLGIAQWLPFPLYLGICAAVTAACIWLFLRFFDALIDEFITRPDSERAAREAATVPE